MKTTKSHLPLLVACSIAVAVSGCRTERATSVSFIPEKHSETASAKTAGETTPSRPADGIPNAPIASNAETVVESQIPAEGTIPTTLEPGVALSNAAIIPGESVLPERLPYGAYELDHSAFKSDIVYFDFDRSNIATAEIPKVEEVAVILRALANNAVLIDGHCDERGTEEYNRALGERRALTIRESLMALGIAPGRIHTRSLGEDAPAVSGQSEEAWSRNRRGEFVLLVPRE